MSAAIDPTTDGSTLAVAQQAVARGWRPFPLDHPAHEDCLSRRCSREREDWDGRSELDCPHGVHDKRGKHPVGHWPTQAAAQQSPAMLRMWFGNHPVNIGVACKPSGLVVLDEDELDALMVFAAELGQSLPRTYRVRTARGWHWYFKVPAGVVVGNRTGTLKARHIDVRGGKGDGGYVVAAGSTHWTGHVYTAEDETAPLADLPAWIIEQIQADSPSNATGNEFNPDDVRTGTREELEATYRHHLAQVATPGFENSFFTAARDGYRMAALGMPLDHVHADLFLVVQRVWGAAPNAGDQKLLGQARTKAIESPWELRGQVLELRPVAPTVETSGLSEPTPTTSAAPTVGAGEDTSYDPEETARRAAEKREADEFAAELEKERRRRRVREHLAREEAAPLRVLRGLEFLQAPQPEYLVPSMLYKASTAKVFGPPGSTKSFLLMDLALSLATGRPWHGVTLPRTRVHFVMAEGQAVNVSRALAWLHDRGVPQSELDGWFDAIPQGVLLTPAGVEQYVQLVEQDRPGLVILDTKNAMMDGDENHASDVAVMVRAMRAIRDASDACVALVDHTGITDTGRGRGSNAVTAAMDTEIRVERGDGGGVTATVTRDKAAEDGAAWHYTLRRVEGVPGLRPGSKPPAVCQPQRDEGAESSVGFRSREWWQIYDNPLPAKVSALRGDGADCARDIFRVLWFMGEHEGGVSMATIRRAIGARPKATEPSEATARRGRVLLEDAGVVQALSKGSYALTPAYFGAE